MAFTPRVFSGIKPSGDLHLGNYLGAIRRFVPLQDTHETIYCVVDMHAITVWQEPEDLRRWTYEIAAAYIAAGVDPTRSIIFNQSQVVEHAELAWIFNCVARMGWMARMTQFKDKAGENSENVSLGLFAYPSLMAADILLYKATGVPVGDDQRQHLELTRDIAKKFNHDFRKQIKAAGFDEDYFPLTETLATGPAMRVMSLRDGTKKMSKSDASDMSTIYMMDDADTIAKKIKKATTDPSRCPPRPPVSKAAPKPRTSSPSMPRCPPARSMMCWPSSAVRLGQVQAGAGRSRGRRPLPHRHRDEAAGRRQGRDGPHPARRGRSGPGHRPADHGRSPLYRGFCPLSLRAAQADGKMSWTLEGEAWPTTSLNTNASSSSSSTIRPSATAR
jgi:tryptophanyl-tRNA synthetase